MSPLQVLHARAMARLETLVRVPRTPSVLLDMQNLCTGLALLASPNLPGTELPAEVAAVNRYLLARLEVDVKPEREAEFVAEICSPGH